MEAAELTDDIVTHVRLERLHLVVYNREYSLLHFTVVLHNKYVTSWFVLKI